MNTESTWESEPASADARGCELPHHAADLLALEQVQAAVQRQVHGEEVTTEGAPQRFLDRYEVVRHAGRGAMGTVLEARDTWLERQVALKIVNVPSPRQRRRLVREGVALARLSHPNVVQVHDVDLGMGGSQAFVVMEYVEGSTFMQWQRKVERSADEIVTRYVDAARGLGAAHREGIVHRDFKPHNVLLGREGEVKVADFGLALAQAEEMDSAAKEALDQVTTAPRRMVGMTIEGSATVGLTPGYCAPEQLRGKATTAKSDQFSFCVALFEALTGTLPFGASRDADEYQQRVAVGLGSRPANFKGSARVFAALVRGLSLQPSDRFGAMDELIAQLTPRRPWWPWLTASAVSLAAITWAFVASAQKIEVEVPVDPCLEPGQELAIRWSPEAWTPRAPESAAAVSVSPWSIVDDNAARYSESWTQTVEGLCRAAQRGESVGAAHTQALACLGQGAREFNTTAEVVRSRESAEGLEGAFGNLHPPQLCVAPQGRPVFGSASAELIEELEAVRRLQLEGDDERALTRARALRGRAEKASDVVVAAQVSFSIGKLEILFNDPEAAVKHLEESALLAERLGDDLLAAEAYAELIDVVTLMWGELDDAVRYGKMGRVKLQRAGAVYSEVAGQYHSAMSNLEFRLRNLEAAAGHAQRAYELLSVRQGHQSLAALIARSNHAAALCDLKRYDDAIASYLHNLELRHRTYGPKHSSTVHDELRLGRVYLKSGRLEPAMAQYRKVEELAVPQVGDIRFSRIAAFSLGRQCEIVVRKGDYASALPYCERAGAALRELPHDRQQRGARQSMRRYYGFALMGVGRYEEALVQLGREHELLLEMSPGNEANLAYNTSARCRVLLELGRATECRSELDHAASWFEKSGRMQSLQNLRAMTKQPQRK